MNTNIRPLLGQRRAASTHDARARVHHVRVSAYVATRLPRALVAAALCGVTVLPARALAARPERVVVHARVDAALGEIAGVLAAEVSLEAGDDAIRLWSYAHRVTVAPAAMDELSWRWVYPGEIDRGRVTIEDLRVDDTPVAARVERAPVGWPRGVDVRGLELRVPVTSGRARSVVLRLRFRVSLPARFGRLGRDGATLALGAPWYPLVVSADAWDYRPWQEVVVDACAAVDAGGRQARVCPKVALGDGAVRTGMARWRGRATYVPAVVSPELWERAVPLSEGRTLRIRMPRVARAGGAGLADLLDVGRHTLSDAACARLGVAADAALATLAAAAPVAAATAPRDLVALVVPLRTELVAAVPGALLVSDRFGEVSPVDATGRFHERTAVREWLRLLVAPLSAATDPPADRPWADDLRATLLLDLDETRRRGRTPTPRELLGFAAFHPAVDQLLYAPQVPFPDVYFDGVDELDRFRDDPMRAFAPIARGRRVLEVLRDASGERFARAATVLLGGEVSARAALVRSGVHPDHIDGWLRAPVEPVNYVLGVIRSVPDSHGFVHEVEVRREGATRTEPVEVRVTDAEGATAAGWWDGEGSRGIVRLRTRAPLADAHVDPRERLPQSPALTSGHPRADDATTHPWRPPLLQALWLSYSASEARLDGLVDFAMRRRYDLDRAIALRLETGPATTGGMLRYVRGFGPKRDTNNRIGVLVFGAEVERLRGAFADGTPTGWGGALLVSAGIDTRRYRLDWRHGVSFGGSVRFGGVAREDGTLSGSVAGAVRGSLSFPLGLRNMVMLVAGGGVSLGAPLPAEQQALGGIAILRGFRSTELVGRARAYAVVEHRATLFADLAWDIGGFVWVRELQLAAFTGAGVLWNERDTSGRRGRDRVLAADAGGGLRVHFLYGGVQPGLVLVDVAVPLAGGLGSGPAFYVAFDQYF